MKARKLNRLSLQKTAVSKLTSHQLTGGVAPTTHKTNITCGGICENSVIVCDER
ncbi:class I lanthipeptide [Kordia zhangzhouensis]|uniref:class I lanthipeptide n=1 Tax=Kordia zhangzhouensis TaxID=1620405 RepID=UPI0012F97882|nr:class I lanthipeptide [Kordia zhangzhouensis]